MSAVRNNVIGWYDLSTARAEVGGTRHCFWMNQGNYYYYYYYCALKEFVKIVVDRLHIDVFQTNLALVGATNFTRPTACSVSKGIRNTKQECHVEVCWVGCLIQLA
jgi:hypothetical protein